MFKFTFETNAKISAIKAMRQASVNSMVGGPAERTWSLRFTKDVVEGGILTKNPVETSEFLSILLRTVDIFNKDTNHGLLGSPFITWKVKELPENTTNRYADCWKD